MKNLRNFGLVAAVTASIADRMGDASNGEIDAATCGMD